MSYYDPAIGTFISRDTYPGKLTISALQHRYTYTENTPVNDIQNYPVHPGFLN